MSGTGTGTGAAPPSSPNPMPAPPSQIPPPSPSKAPAPLLIDQATLTKILHGKRVYPKPLPPRVGGVNEDGLWTGLGAAGDGKAPRTKDCMRKMLMEESKSYALISVIEDRCRHDMKSIPGPQFCLNSEADSKNIVLVIDRLTNFLETHGMEPVFYIETANGTINMLTQPGTLTEGIMNQWIKDLTVDGVLTAGGTRKPVCKYDAKNLDWSFDTILSSCSDLLQREIKKEIKGKPHYHNGPAVLFVAYKLVYRHSESKVQVLLKQASELDLRKYPGENVTLFKLAMDNILDELEMNLMPDQPLPTLRTSALSGLTKSTCDFFRNDILKTSMEEQVGFTHNSIDEVKKVIREAEELYLRMMDRKLYPPGLKPTKDEGSTMRAMQAQVKEVVQKEMDKLV